MYVCRISDERCEADIPMVKNRAHDMILGMINKEFFALTAVLMAAIIIIYLRVCCIYCPNCIRRHKGRNNENASRLMKIGFFDMIAGNLVFKREIR